MAHTAVSLVLALIAAVNAFPVDHEISKFFDYTDASARIVGGTISGPVPYMVALTMGASVRLLLCGGSLITTRHVLTAAHCVESAFFMGQRYESIRGYVDTDRFHSGGTMYEFTHNITHPRFFERKAKHDIALLVTATQVELTARVSLAALSYDFIDAGVPTIAHGWGLTEMGGAVSSYLMRLEAFVVDGNECAEWVPRRGQKIGMRSKLEVDPAVEICCFRAKNRGMCNGDSGSPLMRSDLNQQIGIVSWGLPCARNAPDMFVRISAYSTWIEQNIKIDSLPSARNHLSKSPLRQLLVGHKNLN